MLSTARRRFPRLLSVPLTLVLALQFLAAYAPLPRLSPERATSVMAGPRLGKFTQRVLVRLEQAELGATDPWVQDDLRVAWLTLSYANGQFPDSIYPWASPWERAFHHYYQRPWKQSVEYWAARDRQTAAMFARMDVDGEAQALPAPKKPVQSERDVNWRRKKSA